MRSPNLSRCFIFILSLLSLISSCKKSTRENPQNLTVSEIIRLLEYTPDSTSVSLIPAYEAAKKALSLAQTLLNDTLIVKSRIALGANLRLQGKNDEALTSFQNAMKLSGEINFEKGICCSLIESGTIYYIRGQYEKSGELFRKALEIAQHKKYPELEAMAMNNMGKYMHTTGHFSESVDYYKQAIERYKSQGNLLQSASVMLSLGKTYTNDGDLYMALKCYLDSYETSVKIIDYLNLADVCNHLGTIYYLLDQPVKSMEYHREALNYRIALNTPKGLANSYDNIGKVFLMENKPDSARLYFLKALTNCDQIGYTKGKVKALTNLGKVYDLKLDYRTAKKYLFQASGIATNAGYEAGVAESSLELGKTFIGLDQADSARQYFNLCLEKAKSANLTQLNHDAYWGIYRSYLSEHNFEKSLDYYILFAEAAQKLIQAENNRKLSELRISFETESKEKDNEVLRKDNELKEMAILHKNAFIWMFIVALVFAIVLVIMFYLRFENKKKAHRRLEELNNRITKQNTEYSKLNKELEKANQEKDKIFSIIAHELRNPLYWFKNLTEMLSLKFSSMPPENVQTALGALDESAKNAFHLMDNLLHWSRSRLNRIKPVFALHSLEKLIDESTRMYETILKQKNIRLSSDLPEMATIQADSDLFMCVVRNLVSNAIKFTPENGAIKIHSKLKEEHYIISVSDSGIGIDQKNKKAIFSGKSSQITDGLMNEKGSGFGLKLCKEFVHMNGGKIWISGEIGTGTCFSFTVPAANFKR